MTANALPVATASTRKAGVKSKYTTHGSNQSPAVRQKETAQYISDMILELRNMAKANQLFQVMVPLEYAYYEAFSAANKVEPPPEEVERLRQLSKVSDNLEAEIQDY